MSWSTYAQFGFALVFVLSLIGGVTVIARRLGYGHAARGPRSRRLALVEVLPLDARRRLVLVRRDHVEHLLMIGPASEHVVESAIGAAPSGQRAAGPSFAAHLPASEGDAGAVSCAGR